MDHNELEAAAEEPKTKGDQVKQNGWYFLQMLRWKTAEAAVYGKPLSMYQVSTAIDIFINEGKI